jgi:hypothetical protein
LRLLLKPAGDARKRFSPRAINGRVSPLEVIHPGFSKTAEHIYFYLNDTCLELFVQQGPYGGSHLGANKIERFYLSYTAGCFSSWSFYRQIFGSEDIEIHLKGEDFSKYYDEGKMGDHEFMQIRIPRQRDAAAWDLSKTTQLLISRDTGMVYGYGPKRGVIRSFVRDIWSELRTDRAASRGVWYNSNSGMPLPNFYQRVLDRKSK